MDRRELEKAARPANFGFKVSLGVIFVAIGAGCLVAGLLGSGGDDFLVVGIALAILFAAIGLCCLFGAWPRRLRGVELRVQPETVARGERMSVTVERTRAKRSLQIGLVCARVELRGQLETGFFEVRELFHEEWRELVPGEQIVEFEVPNGKSPSFRAGNVRTAWSVIARRRRGPLAARTTRVIEVVK